MIIRKQSLLAAGLVAAAISPAFAETQMSTAIVDGMVLEYEYSTVYVRKGSLRARLLAGFAEERPVIDAKSRTVTFTASDDYCETNPTKYSFAFDQLRARLENAAAFGLHRKKKFAESKAGFAKAATLDPKWNIAAINLASAQQLLGEKVEAVKTLQPWLTSDPLPTYAKVIGDPELAPLAADPVISALKAKVAGNAKVSAKGIVGDFVFSAEKNLLALVRREASWGAETNDLTIEIFDVTKGKILFTMPIHTFEDTSPETGAVLPSARKLVAQRVTNAQKVLRDLGFSTTAGSVAKETTTEKNREEEKFTYKFAKPGLGVAASGGVARVLKGDTVLGQGQVLDRISAVVYVAAINAVVVSSGRAGREGCEGSDPTQTTLVTLSAAK